MRTWISLRASSARRMAPMRPVVDHVTRGVDEPVLAVDRIRVERHVGDDADLRKALLHFANAARDEPLVVERLFGSGALERRVDDRKENDRGDCICERLLNDLEHLIDAQTGHSGHGRHRFGDLAALAHEKRQDQVLGRKPCLAHQAPREVVAARSAHAPLRKTAEAEGHLRSLKKGGNFSTGVELLSVEGLLLPRFSSLSGRLNPN